MALLPTEPLQIVEPFRGRNDTRRNLVGLSRDDLKTTLVEAGLEPFRARQVWQWIYWHGVRDFGLMSNIARKTQARLDELFVIQRPEIATEQRSTDGTRKWLLRFADGNEAETVNIPEEDRGSVCVSSQVGCTLTCSFCHTGHPGPGAQPGARGDRRPVQWWRATATANGRRRPRARACCPTSS